MSQGLRRISPRRSACRHRPSRAIPVAAERGRLFRPRGGAPDTVLLAPAWALSTRLMTAVAGGVPGGGSPVRPSDGLPGGYGGGPIVAVDQNLSRGGAGGVEGATASRFASRSRRITFRRHLAWPFPTAHRVRRGRGPAGLALPLPPRLPSAESAFRTGPPRGAAAPRHWLPRGGPAT